MSPETPCSSFAYMPTAQELHSVVGEISSFSNAPDLAAAKNLELVIKS